MISLPIHQEARLLGKFQGRRCQAVLCGLHRPEVGIGASDEHSFDELDAPREDGMEQRALAVREPFVDRLALANGSVQSG